MRKLKTTAIAVLLIWATALPYLPSVADDANQSPLPQNQKIEQFTLPIAGAWDSSTKSTSASAAAEASDSSADISLAQAFDPSADVSQPDLSTDSKNSVQTRAENGNEHKNSSIEGNAKLSKTDTLGASSLAASPAAIAAARVRERASKFLNKWTARIAKPAATKTSSPQNSDSGDATNLVKTVPSPESKSDDPSQQIGIGRGEKNKTSSMPSITPGSITTPDSIPSSTSIKLADSSPVQTLASTSSVISANSTSPTNLSSQPSILLVQNLSSISTPQSAPLSSIYHGPQTIAQETILPNGLKVLVLENHEFPVVSTLVWYHVGSRDEQPGATGLSHMVEHLMFQEVGPFKPGEIGSSIARVGGQFNGYTSDDFTTFFETLPANKIEMALKIESERMYHTRFSAGEVKQEIANIYNEFENESHDPLALISKEVRAIMFTQHPYHNPTIGKKSDLDTLSADHAKTFYEKYFLPANATLIISGDLSAKHTLALVHKYFGTTTPNKKVAAHAIVSEPAQHSERKVNLKYSGSKDILQLAYRAPAMNDADAPVMVVLERLLNGGVAGRLKVKLVDSKICAAAQASYEIKKEPGIFAINCTALPGSINTQAKMLEGLDSLIAQLRDKPPADIDVRRARNQAEFSYFAECDGPYRAGFHLGYFDSLDKWQNSYTWADRLRAVSPADLNRVAKKYLSAETRVVGWISGTQPASPKPQPKLSSADMLKDCKKSSTSKLIEHTRLTGYKSDDDDDSPTPSKSSKKAKGKQRKANHDNDSESTLKSARGKHGKDKVKVGNGKNSDNKNGENRNAENKNSKDKNKEVAKAKLNLKNANAKNLKNAANDNSKSANANRDGNVEGNGKGKTQNSTVQNTKPLAKSQNSALKDSNVQDSTTQTTVTQSSPDGDEQQSASASGGAPSGAARPSEIKEKERKTGLPAVIHDIPSALGDAVTGNIPAAVGNVGMALINLPGALGNIGSAVGTTASALGRQIVQLKPSSDTEPEHVSQHMLKNGINIIVFRSRISPVVQITGSIEAGEAYSPRNKQGCSLLASCLLNQGSVNHDRSQMVTAQDNIGIAPAQMLKFDSEMESIDFSARCLSRDLSTELNLLADTLSKPDLLDDGTIDKCQQEALATIKRNEENIAQKADRVLLSNLLDENSPFCPADPSDKAKTISQLDLAQEQKFFSSHIVPGATRIVFAGDVNPEEVFALAEKAFADWDGNRSHNQLRAKSRSQRILRSTVPIKDSKKTSLCFGQIIPLTQSHPEYGSLLLADSILVNHPMFSRFEKALSKTPALDNAIANGEVNLKLEPVSNLTRWSLLLSVDPSAVPLSIKTVKNELQQIAKTGVNAEEFTEVKRYLLGSLPVRTQATLGTIGNSILDSAEHCGTVNGYMTEIASIKSSTIESVNKVIRNTFKPAESTIVIAGGAQSIKAGRNRADNDTSSSQTTNEDAAKTKPDSTSNANVVRTDNKTESDNKTDSPQQN